MAPELFSPHTEPSAAFLAYIRYDCTLTMVKPLRTANRGLSDKMPLFKGKKFPGGSAGKPFVK